MRAGSARRTAMGRETRATTSTNPMTLTATVVASQVSALQVR